MTASNDFDPALDRAEAVFGAADAASLAQPHRLSGADGVSQRCQFCRGRGVPADGRLAGIRLFRPRRAGDLLGVPDQFPPRRGQRGNFGDAVGAARAPGQPPRPCRGMGAQSALGAARPEERTPNSASSGFIWSRRAAASRSGVFWARTKKQALPKPYWQRCRPPNAASTYNPLLDVDSTNAIGIPCRKSGGLNRRMRPTSDPMMTLAIT